jgi:hypothetical protein
MEVTGSSFPGTRAGDVTLSNFDKVIVLQVLEIHQTLLC